MNTITIPKNLIKDDLIIIPRKEYESLLKLKTIKEFTPTLIQKKAINKARQRIAAGEFYTLNELRSKLGVKNR